MQTNAPQTLTVAGLTLACALVWALSALAQIERVADPNWTTPRTPDGQPDLQGIWGNKTITPIERPDGETRAYLPDEEMAVRNQQRAQREAAQDAAPARRYEAGANVGGYGSYWLDSGDTVLSTGQTSFVVDPPSGRAPIRRCLRRSLLIGQLHPYNRGGHEESHPPVHLSHEPDRWDGVRYLRV